MDSVLARKPLTPAELAESPCCVCVTGGAGYIASTIVCRLLAAGHTVHATYRERDDARTIAALSALGEGRGRLTWFRADLMEEGSFDEAVAGCRYLIHTAAPVVTACPAAQALPRVVTPAMRGVRNVLSAASRAGSVERVVMTSSLYAATGVRADADAGRTVTEESWNLELTPRNAYFMAKTLSEWEAWAIASQQSRWSLVTINPAAVAGPPIAANSNSETVAAIRRIMDGSFYPCIAPVDSPMVDIADVAAAHCLAMVTPEARGRYLLCERTVCATEMAAMLRLHFPQYWIPYLAAPFCLSALVLWLTGLLSHEWLAATYRRRTQVSSEKALRELRGLGPLIPLDVTLRDMGQALIDLGLLPRVHTRPRSDASCGNGMGAQQLLRLGKLFIGGLLLMLTFSIYGIAL